MSDNRNMEQCLEKEAHLNSVDFSSYVIL